MVAPLRLAPWLPACWVQAVRAAVLQAGRPCSTAPPSVQLRSVTLWLDRSGSKEAGSLVASPLGAGSEGRQPAGWMLLQHGAGYGAGEVWHRVAGTSPLGTVADTVGGQAALVPGALIRASDCV